MPMKPSSTRKKINRTQARNAALMNLLGTPGLGTLMAGRRAEGAVQLLLFLAGFVLFCQWAFRQLGSYYRMMFSDTPPPAAGGLGWVWLGVGLCGLAWVWSLVTSLGLYREVSKVSLESLESFAAGQIKLDPAKVMLALATIPEWQRQGEIISRTLVFKDFPAAMQFINQVASLAELAQHHPDIDVRWNKVTLALTTHDAGGLTAKDFALAKQCDGLAKG